MMTDTITVEFSLSVDTILNIIGGAMIVVTVVVFSVMGKMIYFVFSVCQQSTSEKKIFRHFQFCVSSARVLFTRIVQGFGKQGESKIIDEDKSQALCLHYISA